MNNMYSNGTGKVEDTFNRILAPIGISNYFSVSFPYAEGNGSGYHGDFNGIQLIANVFMSCFFCEANN